MCSSPKGSGGRPRQSSAVNSLSGDMSAAQYSNMVQRSNESYERRQKELEQIRAARKSKLNMSKNAAHHPSDKADSGTGFISWLKNVFLRQHTT